MRVSLGRGVVSQRAVHSLVTARSLIMSSLHVKRSLTCRPSYSRPSTGVKSWFLKLSRVPLYFNGCVARVRACRFPPTNWPSSFCSPAGSSTAGMVIRQGQCCWSRCEGFSMYVLYAADITTRRYLVRKASLLVKGHSESWCTVYRSALWMYEAGPL